MLICALATAQQLAERSGAGALISTARRLFLFAWFGSVFPAEADSQPTSGATSRVRQAIFARAED